MQSADNIPNFDAVQDRFDHHWNKFVSNRKSEEHSATIARRNFKSKFGQYVLYD